MVHQYDQHDLSKDSSCDDMVLNDSKSIDSKRSPRKKIKNVKYKGFVISNTKKIKPTETSPKKYKKPSKGNAFMKCRECGMWCKGPIGIKMHTCKVHKVECTHYSDTLQSDSMLENNEEQQNESKIDQLNSSDADMFSYKKEPSFVSPGSSKKKASKPKGTPEKKFKDISKPYMFIKCRICGVLCSGTKGIKMHTNMVHKIEYKDTLQADSVLEIPKQPEQIKMISESENAGHPNLLSNNELINLNPIQPRLCGEVHKLNDVVTLGNQPNVQPLSVPHNQNKNVKFLKIIPKDYLQNGSVLEEKQQTPEQSGINSVPENAAHPIFLPQPEMPDKVSFSNTLDVGNHPNEGIPKFEYHSQSYKKWLRKFVYKCKKQNYPLPAEMCKDISHVLDEISTAIGNPIGFQNMRTCHYIFLRLHRILSEIMTGQMRLSLVQ